MNKVCKVKVRKKTPKKKFADLELDKKGKKKVCKVKVRQNRQKKKFAELKLGKKGLTMRKLD